MKYRNVIPAVFIDRPNRFIAHVDIGGRRETVHVKNTGRCRELLLPGAEVWLSGSDNPARKTAYDLIAVRKSTGLLVNIDSQAPNTVAREWLDTRGFDLVRPEFPYGQSRLDFMMERGSEKFLMEVKGCTLEREGIGYFPDAPTELPSPAALCHPDGRDQGGAGKPGNGPGLLRCPGGGEAGRCTGFVFALPRGTG